MGQIVRAIMLGCPMPASPKGKAWTEEASEKIGDEWVDVPYIFEDFKWGRGPTLETDENMDTLGIFIVGGAELKRAGPISFADFERAKPYAKACAAARKQWARLVAHAAAQGAMLPDTPSLFLVRTEIA